MRAGSQGGFTYVGVLLAIALLGIGLSTASEVWSVTARRQQIEQLEWVGAQFVAAIGSYYESTPGLVKRYPRSLDDLLEDNRTPFVRRHLRQIYVNPLDPKSEWILLKSMDGGVRGIAANVMDPHSNEFARREYVYIEPRRPK